MKPNARKTADLKGLRKLIDRWQATKSRKRRVMLRRQISNANDAFHARWKHDGVVALFKEAR